ncbi:hypothetical protein FQN50_007503 [Emmonsiellopsis sp. PD_5]|nr:hypothetical protein FQN50_007503 [Emmonsiellopsis sp. PD_5]
MTPPPTTTTTTTNHNPPIFLLKTKSTPHDGYSEYFSSKSYNPLFIPVLEHKFNTQNLHRVRDLFVSGDIYKLYGGLIFTSQRAVEGFARVLGEEVGEKASIPASNHLTLYTVGPATYRSLNTLRQTHLPHAQLIGHDAGTGEKLARVILEHYNGLYNSDSDDNNVDQGRDRDVTTNNEPNEQQEEPTTGGTQDDSTAGNKNMKKQKLPLLFLIGEQHRDIIPKTLMDPTLPAQRRIGVEELVVYETGVMEGFERAFAEALSGARGDRQNNNNRGERRMGDADGNDRILWVVVFSPTGCEAMLRTLGLIGHGQQQQGEGRKEGRGDCYIATIGPTTRDHLRVEFGVEPDVCAEVPSPEGVGRGIERFIEGRGV